MSIRSPRPRAIRGLVVAVLTAEMAGAGSLRAQQTPLRPGQTAGPRFVMSAMKGEGDGPRLGFQVANAVRERIASDYDMRSLWVVPESTITTYLVQGGYNPDQHLSSTEIGQLARSFSAAELLDGIVIKLPAGRYRVEASWGLTGRDDMLQPLPAVEGEKISDVAKLVAREFQAARKQVEAVQRCINLARVKNYTGALAEANKAIDAYPKSVLGRVCIANIYDQEKLGPDSMIRISSEILAIHPENARALAFAADAYAAKGMVDDQIRVLEQLLGVEPMNHRAFVVLIDVLAGHGQLDRAKTLADTLVAREPGNADALGVQWRVYVKAKDWARVLEIGDTYIGADSSAATRDFFITMIAAADAIGEPQTALDLTTRAVGRFPNDDELVYLRADFLRRSGQVPQALAVVNGLLARNPRAPNAWALKARVESALGLASDTILATLSRGLESGENRATLALYARTFGGAAAKDTAAPNKLDPLRTAIRYFKFAESAQTSDTTEFLLGTTSVRLAQRLASEPAPTKTCELAKELARTVVDAQINLPKSGRAFPQQAPPYLTALATLSQYSDQLSKAVCR